MSEEPARPPSAFVAVAVGHAMVTVPTLMVIAAGSTLGVVAIGMLVSASHAFELGVLFGCALGWPCWSFLVPRWRDWVVDRGIAPESVQRLAQYTGLVWPRGSFVERTEFPRRDGTRGW